MYRPRRPREELAVDLLLAALGEHRFNRSAQEYSNICGRIPVLKQAHFLVNEQLNKLNQAGMQPYEICYFQPGDLAPIYKPFPTSISIQTLRNGLVSTGFRDPKKRRRG